MTAAVSGPETPFPVPGLRSPISQSCLNLNLYLNLNSDVHHCPQW